MIETKRLAEGYDLDKVINHVAKITELSRKEILDAERDRKGVQARSILCFWATDHLGKIYDNKECLKDYPRYDASSVHVEAVCASFIF